MDNLKTRLFHMLISPIVRLLRPERARQRSLRACPMRQNASPLLLFPKNHALLKQALFPKSISKPDPKARFQKTAHQSKSRKKRLSAFPESVVDVNSLIYILLEYLQQHHTWVQIALKRFSRIKRFWIFQFSIPP